MKGIKVIDIGSNPEEEVEFGTHGLCFSHVIRDYPFDDVVIMQSTGLVDKNGKEIFEGDIVHAYSEGARLIGVIEYFDNAYCIKDKNGIYNSLWINAEHYEVVGNIWEDDELVEETDE